MFLMNVLKATGRKNSLCVAANANPEIEQERSIQVQTITFKQIIRKTPGQGMI